MERRFRNLQSPKYLGSDKRSKAREQEGVSAQRKRQGFDVAVNPLSGQPRLFGRPRRRFFPRTQVLFRRGGCPGSYGTDRLTATPTSGTGNADTRTLVRDCEWVFKLSAPVGGTDV